MYQVTGIDFGAGQTRTVDIDFVTENFQKFGFALPRSISFYEDDAPFGTAYFSYLTHPARNWKGRIKQADFQVRVLGRPKWRDRDRGFKDPGIMVLPKPHKQKGTTYSWIS